MTWQDFYAKPGTMYGVKLSSGIHRGVDFPHIKGTAIPAFRSGTVRRTGYVSDYGYFLAVQNPLGTYDWYCHMLRPGPYYSGDAVSAGATVGAVGTSGYLSTGYHTHVANTNMLGDLRAIATNDPWPAIKAATQTVTPGGGGVTPIQEDEEEMVTREFVRLKGQATVWYSVNRMHRYAMADPAMLADYQYEVRNLQALGDQYLVKVGAAATTVKEVSRIESFGAIAK